MTFTTKIAFSVLLGVFSTQLVAANTSVCGVLHKSCEGQILAELEKQEETELLEARVVMLQTSKGHEASMITDDGLACFQGPEDDIVPMIVAARTSPNAGYIAHGGMLTKSCVELGFTEIVGEGCRPTVTMYQERRETAEERSALYQQFKDNNQRRIQNYAESRGISMNFAKMWTTCEICQGLTPDWLPIAENYDSSVCPSLRSTSEKNALTLALEEVHFGNPDEPVASLIPNHELVCFEGSRSYLQQVLDRVRKTPVAPIFVGVEIQATNCSVHGFSHNRDPIDECFPLASKMMRGFPQESFDMTRFVSGAQGYQALLANYEKQYPLADGVTAVDWFSCLACEPGGANFDRGMMRTNDGRASAPYDSTTCSSVMDAVARHLQQYPISLQTNTA